MAKRDKKGSNGRKRINDALRVYMNDQQKHVNRIYKKHLPGLNKIFKDGNDRVSELYRKDLEQRSRKDKVFKLNEHPTLSNDITELQKEIQERLDAYFNISITNEWNYANKNADNLVKAVFPSVATNGVKKYFNHNQNALKSFLNRNLSKDKSRTISGRVWKITNQYRRDIEDTLAIGILNGDSADSIAKRLMRYLKNPEGKKQDAEQIKDRKLRNELEQLLDSRETGQGIYNSSYKNARRLAVNETNLAYRNAESERIEQLDFVVGYEIKVSNSHALWLQKVWIPRHGSKREICDVMAGKYPKSFKWNSWHPQCKCMRLPILKTWEEIQEDNIRLLRDEEITDNSVNTVREMPNSFNTWITNNKDKINKNSSKPYFWNDNLSIIKEIKG